ncbi:MAG: hypothetical protein IT371_31020 [Deltaproteobacteria bacterium]|nr:hypothetical protein [Deltaproteobacteria bacterium]
MHLTQPARSKIGLFGAALALTLAIAACGGRSLGQGGDGGPSDAGTSLEGYHDTDLGAWTDSTWCQDSGPPRPDANAVPPDGGQARCGKAPPVYAGPLCGGAGLPCGVLVDETLPTKPAYRNDAPSLALNAKGEPALLFSVAESGYHGFYARRQGSTWSVTPTGSPLATGALVMGPNDAPQALFYDGTPSGNRRATFSGATWTVHESLPAQRTGWSGGLAVDRAGCLYAPGFVHLVYGGPQSTTLLSLAPAPTPQPISWIVTPILPVMPSEAGSPPVALSPEGRAQLAFFRTVKGEWELAWAAPPLGAEPVARYGSSSLSHASQVALVVTPVPGEPLGRPHVFFKRFAPASPERLELTHASRDPTTAAWRLTAVASEDVGDKCTRQPTMTGESCSYDLVEHVPVGAVASGNGDVRLFVSRLRHHAKLTATCDGPTRPPPPNPPGPPPMGCRWQGAHETEGRLELASLQAGGGFSRAIVKEGLVARHLGSAALDAAGRLHLALYAAAPASTGSGSTVRYLRLGLTP